MGESDQFHVAFGQAGNHLLLRVRSHRKPLMNRSPRRPAGKTAPEAASALPRPKTPEEFCAAALRLLKAGEIAEAEISCRQALTLDAGYADALHAMGLVSFAFKRHDLAVEWFARAITQKPTVADYFSDLGRALEQRDRFDEAIRCYDRALQIDGSIVESWRRLAALLQQQGRPGEAAQAYDRLLKLIPDDGEIWYRLGEMLKAEGRRDEAALSFDQALKLKPDYIDAANNAAVMYFESQRYDEAIARFDQSLLLRPEQAGALCLKGISLRRLRRYDEALVSGERAHRLSPDDADIANSLGCILQNLGRHDDAVAMFDRAIAIRPEFPDFHNHRGTSLAEQHQFEPAFASFDRAVALNPGFADAHWNAALYRLLVGDFATGWAAREWGRKCRAVGFVARIFDAPQWLAGAPLWSADAALADKTILLHSDEGLGDTIQFCRYATLLAAQGARVLLEVDAKLQPLLSGVDGVTQCLARSADELPAFDYHCPLSSLPLVFATDLATIPSMPSYLPAPPIERRQYWQDRLGAHDKLRVGLVWSGNPAHLNDHNRSVSLSLLVPMLDADVRFVSLQKDPRPADQDLLAARGNIVDFTAELTDFVDTAALICCLDLVITVDTSVAHLAGALGCPTWVMLPHTPDYRWLLDRDDSPWYPSLRLFRQDADRNYRAVIARIDAALRGEAAAWLGA